MEKTCQVHTVVGHGQNGNLSNGSVAALDTSGALVDGGQIRVHVTRVSTTSGHFFSGCGDLAQGIAVGGEIGENDQDVLLELVGVVLGGGEGETGGDDALNSMSSQSQFSRSCMTLT
jgi:hypothetical protein